MDFLDIDIFCKNFKPLKDRKINIIYDVDVKSDFNGEHFTLSSYDKRGVKLTTVLFDQNYFRDQKLSDILDQPEIESPFGDEVWIYRVMTGDPIPDSIRISCSIDSLKNYQQ
jgi:hypothetical protein